MQWKLACRPFPFCFVLLPCPCLSSILCTRSLTFVDVRFPSGVWIAWDGCDAIAILKPLGQPLWLINELNGTFALSGKSKSSCALTWFRSTLAIHMYVIAKTFVFWVQSTAQIGLLRDWSSYFLLFLCSFLARKCTHMGRLWHAKVLSLWLALTLAIFWIEHLSFTVTTKLQIMFFGISAYGLRVVGVSLLNVWAYFCQFDDAISPWGMKCRFELWFSMLHCVLVGPSTMGGLLIVIKLALPWLLLGGHYSWHRAPYFGWARAG